MTNELEKQFFDTFGIEPKLVISLEDWERCKDLPRAEELFKYYPQITDRILLELICIANQHEDYPISTNIKNIQAQTLRTLLKAKKYLKDTYSHQGCHNSLVRKVRKLFKGDNNV